MDWQIFAFLVVVFLAVVILKALGRKTDSDFPYRLKDKFYSAAERSFFGVLTQAAAANYVVFGKVRVADVLTPAKGLNRSNWQTAFNKINSKHFDFVLCNPDTLAVECVVELNDRSHTKTKRATRDAFLRGACQSAGLKLLEVEAKASYSVVEVRGLINGGRDV